MPCNHVRMPGGGTAIVCTRGRRPQRRCKQCGRPATLLCDFPVAGGKTCDAPICHDHAREVGPDLHHCDKHAAAEPAATQTTLAL